MFHAERQDFSFKFSKNKYVTELEWINEILESLLVELIKNNKNWVQNS